MAKLNEIWYELTFSERLLQGNFIKEVVRRIFEESDYLVFPFGYESFLTQIKHIIQEKKFVATSQGVIQRVSTSPDLVVYDQEKDIKLVEVKSKNWDPGSLESIVPIDFSLDTLKREWKNAILILVVPFGHWFYAQEVEKINSYKDNLGVGIKLSEFELFENIFSKITADILYSYKKIAAKVFGIFGTPRDDEFHFPENKEINENLLEFIKRNPNLIGNKEELFRKYNAMNLISRKKFDENYENLKKRNMI
jgi:hypothetical protein